MYILQPLGQWERKTRRAAVLMGGLLVALAAGPAAHAVTYVTVDGHPDPVKLVVGETVTVRFDVAKPGGTVQCMLTRDLTGAGKYDDRFPAFTTNPITDGDTDPTPGKIAWALPVLSELTQSGSVK